MCQVLYLSHIRSGISRHASSSLGGAGEHSEKHRRYASRAAPSSTGGGVPRHSPVERRGHNALGIQPVGRKRVTCRTLGRASRSRVTAVTVKFVVPRVSIARRYRGASRV